MSKENDRKYWYDYVDINNLLQEGSQDNAYEVMESASTNEGDARRRIERAFRILENPSSPNVIVIPINVGRSVERVWLGLHWVGLCIKKIGSSFRAFYADSLGTPMERSFPTLKKLLEKHGVTEDNITDFQIKQQSNDYDCGPWTVFNLNSLARISNLSNASDEDIVNQRQRLPSSSFHVPEEPVGTPSKQLQNIDQVANQLSLPKSMTPYQCNGAHPSGYTITEYMFPRCEYKTRFKGTSAFNMSDSDYWGSYFRSPAQGGGDRDRIAAMNKTKKTYANENTNNPPKNKKTVKATKAGTIKSPWVNKESKKIFISRPLSPKKTNKNNNALLYDQLLEYKKSVCDAVVKRFSSYIFVEDKKINVYYENDYPCVMVQVPDFHEGKNKIINETNSFYSIVVAYFTSITNDIAKDRKIPIELVNRASFGHNIPSVTETATSFRINIGIVPKVYAVEVLAYALRRLNTLVLEPLLNKNIRFKLNMDQNYLNIQNYYIQIYNNAKNAQVKKWTSNDDLLDVLCKIGDSGNRKVSYQIIRKSKYIDLLTDYVKEELNNNVNEEFSSERDLSPPLRKILKKLDYSNERATLEITHFNNELTQFDDDECQDIANDSQFWKIIEDINLVFTNFNINILSESIKKKKIIGLYSKLEKANLDFIRNSSYQGSKDGHGSDSDCDIDIEGEDESFTFHSKKIIVSTGIRAINLAQFLAIFKTNTTKADTSCMYYETANAIELVADIRLQSYNLECGENEQEQIRHIDLTYCASAGPDSKLPELSAKSGEQLIVFDCTSATTERIREAIKLIEKVPILLLVSSGLKNEQIGADTNPYGTIRIIARDINTLNQLYFLLKAALNGKEVLPKELHNIRKAYKDAGAVVTSAAIYSRGYHCSHKSNMAEDYDVGGYNFPEKFIKIMNLFGGHCTDEIHNLTMIHKQDINKVVSWSMDKIELLGSISSDVVEAYSSDFNQIIDDYDKDPELAKKRIADATTRVRHQVADVNQDDNNIGVEVLMVLMWFLCILNKINSKIGQKEQGA